MREMQIFDYKKKIAEAETKLKQQQNLYEAVRSDRNLYSKNLIESQDEITEMKRKLKIMNHQIDQLKEEISSKEAALVKEQLEHQRVEKEKESLKSEWRGALRVVVLCLHGMFVVCSGVTAHEAAGGREQGVHRSTGG